MCNNTFTQLMISVFLCQFCFYGITLTLSLSCPVAADYVAVDSQLTFPSMSPLGSTQCVTITITDDVITEPEETFSVILVPVSDFVTIGEISVSSVTVGDSDCKCALLRMCLNVCHEFILSTAVSVSMLVLDEEFDEEDGAGLVCVILSEGQLDGITATVALSTSDDTATSPSGNKKILRFMLSITLSFTGDYVALMSEVTFGPTATSGDSDCVEVSLVDDANVEVTEQFNITVVATSDIVSIRTPSSAVYIPL